MEEDLPDLWINKGVPPFEVDQAEKKFNAKFIGIFQTVVSKNKAYWWSVQPISVFYQYNPPNDYSNYMGLFSDDMEMYITSAEIASTMLWNASEAKNGEIIYSRYRHDYRTSEDGTAMIDGGADYCKMRGKHANLKIVGDELVKYTIPKEWFIIECNIPFDIYKNANEWCRNNMGIELSWDNDRYYGDWAMGNVFNNGVLRMVSAFADEKKATIMKLFLAEYSDEK